MLFNSLSFAVFLPVVFAIYWLLPHKYRWLVLLVSSYYFYMSWNVTYVVLIAFTTFVSYSTALMIGKGKVEKKLLLAIAIFVCVGILVFFKYFNFFSKSISEFFGLSGIRYQPLTFNLILPVGISFYTFQTLSYVIDVYRGTVIPEKNFGIYALFISFFPQLVAGPIERTKNLLPQLKEEQKFDYDKASYGLKLMAWGFYKKIVIADMLAVFVDRVYNNLNAFQGLSLIIPTVFFAFQIYCDFSGYSDIAIGTAKLFGIDLMHNFKSPYFSSSIKEFWSRWHISLSTWFKDYIYIPLGGNRCGKFKHARNLMLTFLISGLWHGANWNYVVWGGIHGLGQIIEGLFRKRKKAQGFNGIRILSILFVFLFCCIAWVFFRTNSLEEAGYVFCHMFNGISSPGSYIRNTFMDFQNNKSALLSLMVCLIPLFIYDFLSLKYDVIEKLGSLKLPVRWLFYTGLTVMILIFSKKGGAAEFVYFQF